MKLEPTFEEKKNYYNNPPSHDEFKIYLDFLPDNLSRGNKYRFPKGMCSKKFRRESFDDLIKYMERLNPFNPVMLHHLSWKSQKNNFYYHSWIYTIPVYYTEHALIDINLSVREIVYNRFEKFFNPELLETELIISNFDLYMKTFPENRANILTQVISYFENPKQYIQNMKL
jgi:hypothetical protein